MSNADVIRKTLVLLSLLGFGAVTAVVALHDDEPENVPVGTGVTLRPFRAQSRWGQKMPLDAPTSPHNAAYNASMVSTNAEFCGSCNSTEMRPYPTFQFEGAYAAGYATAHDNPSPRYKIKAYDPTNDQINSNNSAFWPAQSKGIVMGTIAGRDGRRGIRIPKVLQSYYTVGATQGNDTPINVRDNESDIAPLWGPYYLHLAEVRFYPYGSIQAPELLWGTEGISASGQVIARDGVWSARAMSFYRTDSYAISAEIGPPFPGHRGYAAMNGGHRGVPGFLVGGLYDNAQAGDMGHTLDYFLSNPGPRPPHPIWPMSGAEARDGLIPEGVFVRLKPERFPDSEISRILSERFPNWTTGELTRASAIVAMCRDYGLMVGDTSGSFSSVEMQNMEASGRSERWGAIPPTFMQDFRFAADPALSDWEFIKAGYGRH